MITASIVLYKTDNHDLEKVVNSYNPVKDRLLYLIDNSPEKSVLPDKIINNPFIIYIFLNKNIGYGSGHNVAIREAIKINSTYHAVLNPDIYFNNEIINHIVDYMNKNKDIGQIMPKIVNQHDEVQYLCKLIPTPFDLIFKRFLPSKINNIFSYKFQLKFTNYNNIIEVPYLSGCFMFFRIAALEIIGLFDERFFMYPEDIDITRRMNELFKTIYYPEVSVTHIHAAESYRSKKMLFIHITNIIKYFNKWGWFFDNKRRKTNKKILTQLNYSSREMIL